MQNENFGAGRYPMPRWLGLKPLAAAAAIAASLMFAPPAVADCGTVPDAQPPLPPNTTLVWVSDATGACILGTQDYQCTNATGEAC